MGQLYLPPAAAAGKETSPIIQNQCLGSAEKLNVAISTGGCSPGCGALKIVPAPPLLWGSGLCCRGDGWERGWDWAPMDGCRRTRVRPPLASPSSVGLQRRPGPGHTSLLLCGFWHRLNAAEPEEVRKYVVLMERSWEAED